jgi:hypothetical protein
MQAQFLSDGSDYRPRSGGGNFSRKQKSSGMFWWTIIITLLLGVATFSWIFSMVVFKYPEKPFNYRLLAKLKKLEPLTAFRPLHVPNGTQIVAKDLLGFSSLNTEQLRVKNDLLKRAYITNYKDDSPEYIKGTFTVTYARPLTDKDWMGEGWVVRAHASDIEDVELEILLPGAHTDKPVLQEGQTFTLDNRTAIAALSHIERNAADGVCATVVPIIYSDFCINGEKNVALAPPAILNMESRLPVTDTAENPGTVSKVAAQH